MIQPAATYRQGAWAATLATTWTARKLISPAFLVAVRAPVDVQSSK